MTNSDACCVGEDVVAVAELELSADPFPVLSYAVTPVSSTSHAITPIGAPFEARMLNGAMAPVCDSGLFAISRTPTHRSVLDVED